MRERQRTGGARRTRSPGRRNVCEGSTPGSRWPRRAPSRTAGLFSQHDMVRPIARALRLDRVEPSALRFDLLLALHRANRALGGFIAGADVGWNVFVFVRTGHVDAP